MKYGFIILISLFFASCSNENIDNLDGHWHFQKLTKFHTLDISGDQGHINKETSQTLTYDSKINKDNKTITYLFGYHDSLFTYRLKNDTLHMQSVNFNTEYRAVRVNDCTPVKDRFIHRPLTFDLPRIKKVIGEDLGKLSLSLSIIINKINEEIKFSVSDEISDRKEDLEKMYSKVISTIPKSQKDKVFADLYIDKKIKLSELEWIVESLNKSGFTRMYIVFEIEEKEKFLYRKFKFKDIELNNLNIEQWVNMHLIKIQD